MNTRHSILSACALLAVAVMPSMVAAEDLRAVVHDARGNPVLDARGNCVRTQWETGADECGGAVAVKKEEAHTRLASVYFEFNKATLTAKARATLNQLLSTLHDKKIEAVTIAGYADAIGSDSYNLRLSAKRARAVQHYLRIHGFRHANTDIRALGKRDAEATRSCKGLKDGKLHTCMQEDRRVDIELSEIK